MATGGDTLWTVLDARTMTDPVVNELVDQLDALMEDSSMPELVAALVILSRSYKDQLKAEKNNEWQGWAVWDDALSAALVRVGGQEEYDELLGE